MLIKNSGFAVLECVVSMFIISIMTFIITFSMHNNIILLKKNRDNFEMIHLIRQIIEDTRDKIKNSSNIKPYSKEEEFKNFKISTKVNSTEYYNCYKLNVNIRNENNNLELNTYVTKE